MEQKQIRPGQPDGSKPIAKSAATKPAATKPTATKPAIAKPTATKPAATKPAAAKPAAAKPTAAKPTATKPAAAKSTDVKSAAAKKRKSKRLARRKKRIIRRTAVLLGCTLILLLAFYWTVSVIGGRPYLRSAQKIDLRGHGLTDVRSVARLTDLDEALLSGNGFTDVSALASLANCRFIDLTNNPVSAESYAQLRKALPSCVILCEAADDTTASMTLGGHPLPDLERLTKVFSSHSALKTVDLRGSNLRQRDVDVLRSRFPHIAFLYSGTADTTMLNLGRTEDAAEAISSLSGPTHVTLTGCRFAPEEYAALTAQFPDMTLDCIISLCDVSVLSTAAEIDLSRTVPDASLAQNLRLFPNLRTLILPETLPSEAVRLKESLGLDSVSYLCSGSLISPESTIIDLQEAPWLDASELSLLIDSLPQLKTVVMDSPDDAMLSVVKAHQGRIHFIYEVTAFGKTFSTGDEVVDFGDSITDDDVESLMALIDQMPGLKEANMYESTLSQASMDRLFDTYPDVFFGWTFRMCKGKYVVRSDITAFCTQLGAPLHEFTQEHLGQLRYCKNMEALDLCHNAITDLEFISGMSKLKLLIIGDNQLTDISPLAKLKELEYLEIFMNYDLTDFSPLSDLPLTDLNIRNPKGKRNQITADPFLSITTLERFWASAGHFNDAEAKRLREALPDCVVCVTLDHSTGDDWRGGGRQEIIERMFDTRIYEPLP